MRENIKEKNNNSTNQNKLYFESKEKELSNDISLYERKSSLISTLRALFFFVGAALLIVGISDRVSLFTTLGVILFVCFFCLVKYHEKVSDSLEHMKCMREAVNHYIMRFDDEYKKLPDDGSEFLLSEDTVAYDLDLLGKASLYQLICVCHTEEARRMLADALKSNQLREDVTKINEAVKEFSKDINGAIEFEALGIKGEKNKKNKGGRLFFEFCKARELKIPVFLSALSLILPVLELSFLVLWILGVLGYGYAAVGFLVLLGFSELTRGATDSVVAPMLTASVITRDYLGMLNQIGDSGYDAELLKEIKEEVAGKTGTIMAFRKLNVISEAYKLAFNPVIYMLLNGIFLWNYRLAEVALRWKKNYGRAAAECSDIISKTEYLRSLSVLGIVRDTSFAEIESNSSDSVGLSFGKLYHPLINPEKVVSNSAGIESGITIITGSNMSGKTTFLRTIAVNLVLAYMGAPVCGSRLSASYMKIFTSMRVADDVANGISTFYAEILRIKSMAEYRKLEKPMICMVDEIFKGTNSADRIVGAREAIRRLSGPNSIAMVSTHDFELCSIEDIDGSAAKNYHFEEYYEGDALKFDYKLKNERCTTTNARAILKMAGFDV